jgi:UDP-N-acetyl-D-mannosaminuronate dehydrogenase
MRMQEDLSKALADVDAVVLAVRHQHYLKLTPESVLEMTGGAVAVIDCFGILDDAAIQRYFELGCEVKGLGRGHVQRIKERVRTGK